MNRLPEKFIERMKAQLPSDEWDAFFACYENPPYKGVRLNALKGDRYALKEKISFLGEQIPWEENGFYTDCDKPGNSPYHAAGAFYSQEPSAMCAAPLLQVREGERVLDLCSAPGGKGTQIAEKMHGKGILVLNEPIFARAKILSQNVERLGVKNAVVTCELPEKLSERFTGYFDKVLVDAPCSGEGMFRKNADEALSEWSEENVKACAKRQAHILNEATKTLRVGGRLAYSTCTFAVEEDEGQVCDYLRAHPEMRLLRQEKLYPHKVKGEGHFAALFEKVGEGETPLGTAVKRLKPLKPSVSCACERAFRDFEKSFLKEKGLRNLHEAGGCVYDLPEDVFDFRGLQVLRAGVKLGEWKNGRFEPDHAFVMSLRFQEFSNAIDLSETDERVEKYLRGETFGYEGKNGWCAVCLEGYPLGLGKIVNGTVKNHLPKGLRRVNFPGR